jgi:pimeloyl-ACP methyl ester carboxylesterase
MSPPLVVLAVVVLAVAALLLSPGHTPKIKRAGRSHGRVGVAELAKVVIGDSEQWVMIRSENVDNPILLFVHGGPGTSQLTLMRNNTQPIERHFTVVNWDQRGAGKSYDAASDRSRMHMDQFVSDLIELTRYLEQRFDKKKITLVGHSWGSAIGLLAASNRPDLFNASVGIGQVSNMAESERISSDWTLRQAEAANDRDSMAKLKEIGPPSYTGEWRSKSMTQRRILGAYGGEYHGSNGGAFGVVIKNLVFSTEHTLIDRINFFRGSFDSVDLLLPELLDVDFFAQVPQLYVPVWFMLGRHDYEVPSVLSEQYFDALKAPAKTLFWFENSAHLPNTEERELFNRTLVESVLPAVRSDS